MRVVYGATCTWWDTIDKVGRTKSGLPGCPYCGGVLFELASEELWWSLVDDYEETTALDYRVKIEWVRGKCFKYIPPEGAVDRIIYEYTKAHNDNL